MTRTSVQENSYDFYVAVFDSLDEWSDASKILRGDVSKYYTAGKDQDAQKIRWGADLEHTFDLDVNRGCLLQKINEAFEISLRGRFPER